MARRVFATLGAAAAIVSVVAIRLDDDPQTQQAATQAPAIKDETAAVAEAFGEVPLAPQQGDAAAQQIQQQVQATQAQEQQPDKADKPFNELVPTTLPASMTLTLGDETAPASSSATAEASGMGSSTTTTMGSDGFVAVASTTTAPANDDIVKTAQGAAKELHASEEKYLDELKKTEEGVETSLSKIGTNSTATDGKSSAEVEKASAEAEKMFEDSVQNVDTAYEHVAQAEEMHEQEWEHRKRADLNRENIKNFAAKK